jgi:nucleoside-diphosphate-sugar epimerase
MRYLVTGATGLVGSHVVDHLLERGQAVRALVRQSTAAEALRQRGVEAHRGDLADGADLGAVMAGVDVVVHCAAVVQVAGQPRDVWAVNVEGTERLLAASAAAGLHRFVHLSSVAVYGNPSPPVAEDAAKKPAGPYGKSKWAAEEALWRYHAERGLPGVALRPCAIYGGQDRHAWPVLWRLARMRVIPLPRGGARLVDLVHVSDVVETVMAAATLPAAAGHAYNVTDGETHSYRDVILAASQITGRRPLIVSIPPPALAVALWIGSRLPSLRRVSAGRGLQLARTLDVDLHYSIEAARRDLGYRPGVGLAEGLRRTLAAGDGGASS